MPQVLGLTWVVLRWCEDAQMHGCHWYKGNTDTKWSLAPQSGFAMNCLALLGPEQGCSSLLLTQYPHEDDCRVRLGVLGFIV